MILYLSCYWFGVKIVNIDDNNIYERVFYGMV